MDEHFPKRIALAIIFCLLFIVVGKSVPDFYFRYMDKTPYYTATQPIPVDKKWYKPCDQVTLTVTRNALLNLRLDGEVELILRRADGATSKVPQAQLSGTTTVQKGKATVISKLPLPCDLEYGLYYWQAIVHYKVNGYDKEYFAVSDTFNVNQWGTDPEIIKIATESAKMRDPEVVTRTVLRTVTARPTPIPTSGSVVTQSSAGSSAKESEKKEGSESQQAPEQNNSVIEQVVDSLRKLL